MYVYFVGAQGCLLVGKKVMFEDSSISIKMALLDALNTQYGLLVWMCAPALPDRTSSNKAFDVKHHTTHLDSLP